MPPKGPQTTVETILLLSVRFRVTQKKSPRLSRRLTSMRVFTENIEIVL